MKSGFRVDTRMLYENKESQGIPVVVITYGDLTTPMSLPLKLEDQILQLANEARASGVKPHLVIGTTLSGLRSADTNEEDQILGFLMGDIGGLLKKHFERLYILRGERAQPCWVWGHHDLQMVRLPPVPWHLFEPGWVLRP